MTQVTLTQVQIQEGVWEGHLAGTDIAPSIVVTHLEVPLPDVAVSKDVDGWRIAVSIPPHTLSDGVQTYLVKDADTEDTLASFAIAAGAPLSEDLRAEVDLLRAELDMLKRAFRRHCVETET
ncbi:MAG: hypothetical protein MK180_05420 [Rhodobacteraceae bacterium]|nr:hypothetical protein [Paracoccaceae bacterium]